jgi:hypothetical protein
LEIISRTLHSLFEKSLGPYLRGKTFIGSLPLGMEATEKTTSQKLRSFRTFWTIVVENPSFSEWYFDGRDFGLTALLYFGDFSGGELLLGNPSTLSFQFKIGICFF